MVDAFLTPLLQNLADNAKQISPDYETLWQDIQALYSAGGKRLRSYMTFLTYDSFSDLMPETIVPAASAQELLHMAMLIHDDIIDRDDIRYGVKNISGRYEQHYKEIIKNPEERHHYASSAAILAGDLLISEAYILIAETGVDPAAILRAQRLISKALFHVIGGELLDSEAPFRGENAADPLTIAAQKTASYSFVSPFLMGATLAEAPIEQQVLLQRLGEDLGIAYQLRDDILGVFGDNLTTGKSNDGDLIEGKKTLLVQQFRKLSTKKAQEEFNALFGRSDVTKDEIQKMKFLLEASGAKQAVEELIEMHKSRAYELLDQLTIDQSHRDAFSDLIELCIKREK